MNQETVDCLKIVELKLHSLLQDVRNMRANIESCNHQKPDPKNYEANFFNALRGEDDAESNANSTKTSELK